MGQVQLKASFLTAIKQFTFQISSSPLKISTEAFCIQKAAFWDVNNSLKYRPPTPFYFHGNAQDDKN